MTLIIYHGRAAALAGPERFQLAPHIAQRPDGDALKTFVCYLALYARDVLTGQLPDEPGRYFPERAERYARECLIAPRAFHALAARTDAELAEHFNVPLEQITARRAELTPATQAVSTPPTARPALAPARRPAREHSAISPRPATQRRSIARRSHRGG